MGKKKSVCLQIVRKRGKHFNDIILMNGIMLHMSRIVATTEELGNKGL